MGSAEPLLYHGFVNRPPRPSQTEKAWDEPDLVDPHAAPDKAARVRRMFSEIAPSYDLNNRLHSLWQDQVWRRRAVRAAEVKPTDVVLDAACGTGDLALTFARAGARTVLGIDFAGPMLRRAQEKARSTPGTVAFAEGDALRLPVADRSVDVVSIAFGIRNLTDPAAAAAEFSRVLRPGGRLVIVEFSFPRQRLLRSLYMFYFLQIMPRTATLLSRDRTGAYRYLPRSVDTFLDRPSLMRLMEDAGFAEVTSRPMTFGIAVLYRGVRTV